MNGCKHQGGPARCCHCPTLCEWYKNKLAARQIGAPALDLTELAEVGDYIENNDGPEAAAHAMNIGLAAVDAALMLESADD